MADASAQQDFEHDTPIAVWRQERSVRPTSPARVGFVGVDDGIHGRITVCETPGLTGSRKAELKTDMDYIAEQCEAIDRRQGRNAPSSGALLAALGFWSHDQLFRYPRFGRPEKPQSPCALPGCEAMSTHNGGYCCADHCREHRTRIRTANAANQARILRKARGGAEHSNTQQRGAGWRIRS